MEQVPQGTEKNLSEYLFRMLTKIKHDIESINKRTLVSSKNFIINGSFNIWQNGSSFTTAGYTADMWQLNLVGNIATFYKITPIWANGFAGSKHGIAMSTSGLDVSTDYTRLNQKIEDVTQLAGKTVTLSFIARMTYGSAPIAIEFSQNFGAGSPDAQVNSIGVKQVTLNDTWTRYHVTVDMPGIAGKTLGTANTDYTQINFWIDAGSDFAARTGGLAKKTTAIEIRMSAIRLNVGTKAMDIDFDDHQTELIKCQRYYEKSFPQGVDPVQNVGDILGSFVFPAISPAATIQRSPFVPFKVTKRITPTITLFSPKAASAEAYDNTAGAVCTATAANSLSDTGFSVTTTGNAVTAINYRLAINWVADARL